MKRNTPMINKLAFPNPPKTILSDPNLVLHRFMHDILKIQITMSIHEPPKQLEL